jgi:hypothetical protein
MANCSRFTASAIAVSMTDAWLVAFKPANALINRSVDADNLKLALIFIALPYVYGVLYGVSARTAWTHV